MAVGWLGGMTKTSDRYAKWFGTRVPSVSRGFVVLLVLIGAIPFSAALFLGFGYTIVSIYWWVALLLSILVGALFHILYLLILKNRFNNPSQNTEFHDLIGRIHQRVVVSSKTHVWVRRSEDVFIASTFNPIFNAVIVSEPMVELVMKSPESGEALLAFHFLRVPRSRWFADFAGAVILFLIFTYASSLILVPLATMIAQSLAYGGYFIFSMMSSLASLFIAPIIFVVLVKGAFWRHEPAFVGVESVYGLHPNVAKIQVERGITLNEEEAQTVVWSVRDWEKRKRSSRRMGVCTLVAIAGWIIGIFLIAWIGYIPYGLYISLIMYLPFIIAGVAALITYLLLRRWDNNAMGEVFKETTDYDEPIWMD
jgi:MFS family permease